MYKILRLAIEQQARVRDRHFVIGVQPNYTSRE